MAGGASAQLKKVRIQQSPLPRALGCAGARRGDLPARALGRWLNPPTHAILLTPPPPPSRRPNPLQTPTSAKKEKDPQAGKSRSADVEKPRVHWLMFVLVILAVAMFPLTQMFSFLGKSGAIKPRT